MTTVLTKNTIPICVSVTAGLVLRVHGQELEAGEAGEDEEGVEADHGRRTARWRRTSRYEPAVPGACAPPPSAGEGTSASMTTA